MACRASIESMNKREKLATLIRVIDVFTSTQQGGNIQLAKKIGEFQKSIDTIMKSRIKTKMYETLPKGDDHSVVNVKDKQCSILEINGKFKRFICFQAPITWNSICKLRNENGCADGLQLQRRVLLSAKQQWKLHVKVNGAMKQEEFDLTVDPIQSKEDIETLKKHIKGRSHIREDIERQVKEIEKGKNEVMKRFINVDLFTSITDSNGVVKDTADTCNSKKGLERFFCSPYKPNDDIYVKYSSIKYFNEKDSDPVIHVTFILKWDDKETTASIYFYYNNIKAKFRKIEKEIWKRFTRITNIKQDELENIDVVLTTHKGDHKMSELNKDTPWNSLVQANEIYGIKIFASQKVSISPSSMMEVSESKQYTIYIPGIGKDIVRGESISDLKAKVYAEAHMNNIDNVNFFIGEKKLHDLTDIANKSVLYMAETNKEVTTTLTSDDYTKPFTNICIHSPTSCMMIINLKDKDDQKHVTEYSNTQKQLENQHTIQKEGGSFLYRLLFGDDRFLDSLIEIKNKIVTEPNSVIKDNKDALMVIQNMRAHNEGLCSYIGDIWKIIELNEQHEKQLENKWNKLMTGVITQSTKSAHNIKEANQAAQAFLKEKIKSLQEDIDILEKGKESKMLGELKNAFNKWKEKVNDNKDTIKNIVLKSEIDDTQKLIESFIIQEKEKGIIISDNKASNGKLKVFDKLDQLKKRLRNNFLKLVDYVALGAYAGISNEFFLIALPVLSYIGILKLTQPKVIRSVELLSKNGCKLDGNMFSSWDGLNLEEHTIYDILKHSAKEMCNYEMDERMMLGRSPDIQLKQEELENSKSLLGLTQKISQYFAFATPMTQGISASISAIKGLYDVYKEYNANLDDSENINFMEAVVTRFINELSEIKSREECFKTIGAFKDILDLTESNKKVQTAMKFCIKDGDDKASTEAMKEYHSWLARMLVKNL